MEMYELAVKDYRASLQQNPMERNNWHNMVLCLMELEQYGEADSALDSMMTLWPRESSQCTMKAQVSLAQKDTAMALSRAVSASGYSSRRACMDDFIAQALPS